MSLFFVLSYSFADVALAVGLGLMCSLSCVVLCDIYYQISSDLLGSFPLLCYPTRNYFLFVLYKKHTYK